MTIKDEIIAQRLNSRLGKSISSTFKRAKGDFVESLENAPTAPQLFAEKRGTKTCKCFTEETFAIFKEGLRYMNEGAKSYKTAFEKAITNWLTNAHAEANAAQAAILHEKIFDESDCISRATRMVIDMAGEKFHALMEASAQYCDVLREKGYADAAKAFDTLLEQHTMATAFQLN